MMEIRDPVTGALDYTYVVGSYWYGDFAVTATDYDLTDALPWANYTVNQSVFGTMSLVLDRAEAVMDDGSSVVLDVSHFATMGGFPMHYRDR